MTEARAWVTTVTFTLSWVPVWHGYMPTINHFPGIHNSKKLGSCFQAGFSFFFPLSFFLFFFLICWFCVSTDFTWRPPVCLRLFYRLMVPVTTQLKGKIMAGVMKLHAPWHRRVTHGVRNEFLPFSTGRALYCYWKLKYYACWTGSNTPGGAQKTRRSSGFTCFPDRRDRYHRYHVLQISLLQPVGFSSVPRKATCASSESTGFPPNMSDGSYIYKSS